MQGTIRFFLGLLITMFGVGGVENSVTDPQLLMTVGVCIVGLFIMASGANALKYAK